ncbi:hypothetical protein TUM20983_36910 [Mycobacterium antarcticum]|nr:hypothetical protein TUM20983_36910 [Mycolicibacterium sp. TUM20983]
MILTSGTTGLPKGAPRAKGSPFATAQMVDRIPFPRRGTMVIVSPIFHSTGLGTYLVGAALGNTVVTTRRFNAEGTLALIADHRADMLVAVPTMLHRMVELAPKTITKYDTSSLKAIVIAGSALTPELSNRVQDTFGDVLYNLYGSTECALRLHRMRRGDRSDSPGAAPRAGHRGALAGHVRGGAVRRERPAGGRRRQAGPHLHPQRVTVRGIHRRPA